MICSCGGVQAGHHHPGNGLVVEGHIGYTNGMVGASSGGGGGGGGHHNVGEYSS